MFFITGNKLHFLDGTEWSIGRSADNDIVIGDKQVSRHHAILRRSGLIFTIEDLASFNGVRVNHRWVKSSELHGGEIIKIASIECRLSAHPNSETTAIESPLLKETQP